MTLHDQRQDTWADRVRGAKEDQIDKKTLEISQAGDEVYKSMQDLSDELPDNSPRFVLLSYPLTLVSEIHPYMQELRLTRLLGIRPPQRAICDDQLYAHDV